VLFVEFLQLALFIIHNVPGGQVTRTGLDKTGIVNAAIAAALSIQICGEYSGDDGLQGLGRYNVLC
jgi:hypothetical protein